MHTDSDSHRLIKLNCVAANWTISSVMLVQCCGEPFLDLAWCSTAGQLSRLQGKLHDYFWHFLLFHTCHQRSHMRDMDEQRSQCNEYKITLNLRNRTHPNMDRLCVRVWLCVRPFADDKIQRATTLKYAWAAIHFPMKVTNGEKKKNYTNWRNPTIYAKHTRVPSKSIAATIRDHDRRFQCD